MITRRQAIQRALIAAVAAYAAARTPAQAQTPPAAPAKPEPAPTGPFTLPKLPYSYDALEPYIDARTMEIHHDKHHAAYVSNLNKAVAGYPDLQKKSVEDLLRDLSAVPEAIRTAVRNNGGGHYNHTLFWQMMKKGGGVPGGDLASALNKKFGSYSAFQTQFTQAALGQFGSGWAWLTVASGLTPEAGLQIESTANQDTPLSSGRTPLLGIDVWEHAYYLKYQNKRADYIAAWYNVVNWDFVADRYAAAMRKTA